MIRRDVVPHSDLWHRLRAEGIGGSESAALWGCQPESWDSAFTLLKVKKGLIKARDVVSERMEAGLRLEWPVAQWAADIRGWKIRPGGYAIDDTLPCLRASIDVEIESPVEADIRALGAAAQGPGVMQVKVTDWLEHKKKWIGGHPPPHIGIQHQHELAATGYTWGAIVVLVGGNQLCPSDHGFMPRLEPARPRLVKEIRSRVAAFWNRVQDPADDGSDLIDGLESTKASINALWPPTVPNEEPLDLWDDPEIAELCAGRLSGDSDIAAAQKRREEFQNKIKLKLGSAQYAECEGFSIAVNVDKNGTRRINIKETNRGRRIRA